MESAILTRLYKSIKIFSNENIKLKNNLSLALRTNNRMVNKFHEMEVGKDTKIIELKMKLVEADLIIKRYRKETDFDGTNAPTIKERCENQANQIYELTRQENFLHISLASKRRKINRLRKEITSQSSLISSLKKEVKHQKSMKNDIKKQLEFERCNGFIESNKAELLMIANLKIEAIKQLVAD